MAELKLFLLGNPRLELDDAPIRIKRRKALALLAYLSVTRKPHSRQELAALLWPEASTAKAMMHLRNALYALSSVPELRVLDADLNTISLKDRDIPWTDVVEFRRRRAVMIEHHLDGSDLCGQCLDHLKSAAALVTGPFLQGYAIEGSAEFEHWVTLQSQLLQDEFSRLIHTLLEYFIAHDRWDEARQYETQLSSLFPGIELFLQADTSGSGRFIPPIRCRIPPGQTPFVGRHRELEDLSKLMDDAQKRIITLTGMGGSGKTRLAMQAGEYHEDMFSHGVAWIPLTPVRSPDYILPAMLEALKIKSSSDPRSSSGSEHTPDPGTRLFDFLRDKSMLLIMDNAEHLVPGLTFLGELVAAAPKIKILCTSRERLNIQAEWVFSVPGMNYPQDALPETPAHWDSIALFEQSARRVKDPFEITPENLKDITKICRLVDGIPLAIELAAAWTRMLSCREIADEIQRSLDFLNTSMKDLPERHRTFRAVFHHSWKLLTLPEQICFCKLSILRGSFSIASAREITGAPLQRLASLADKSMIRRNRDGRFEIHELLRQFASEQLENAKLDRDSLRFRHASHYLTLLHQLEPSLQGFNQKQALKMITDDIDNVRAAWQWAAQESLDNLIMSAYPALFIYYDIKSLYQEGSGEFEAAARLIQNRNLSSMAAALFKGISGWFLRYLNPEKCRKNLNEALDCLKNYPESQAWALAFNLVVFLGPESWTVDTPGQLACCESVFRNAGNDWGRAMTWEALGFCRMNDPQTAREAFGKSLALRRQNGDEWGIAMSLHVLAVLDEIIGDDQKAARRFRASLTIRKRLDDDYGGMLHCLAGLGRVAARARNYLDALVYYQEAQALAVKTGNRPQAYACAEIIDELNNKLNRRNSPPVFQDYSDHPNVT